MYLRIVLRIYNDTLSYFKEKRYINIYYCYFIFFLKIPKRMLQICFRKIPKTYMLSTTDSDQ